MGKHYTQQPDDVTVHHDGKMLTLSIRGFVSTGLLSNAIERTALAEGDEQPALVLVDLAGVNGYGPGSPTLAREWLMQIQRHGTRRVALVANSSVLRTTVQIISRNLDVELRCFVSERAARTWLEGSRPMPAASPRPTL